MKRLEFDAGTHVKEAANALVANAPARADFNGVTMRARYATTRPDDVVNQWRRTFEQKAEEWRRSPDGERFARESAKRMHDAQLVVDDCVETLDRVGPAMFRSPSAILSWLDRMAPAADHVGVIYDHGAIAALFASEGWAPGANCGVHFDGSDSRNFAGWIVGQWLASRWPRVTYFIEQWRETFPGEAS